MSAVVRIDLSEPLKSLLEASVWQALSPGGLPQVMGGEPAFPLWVFKCSKSLPLGPVSTSKGKSLILLLGGVSPAAFVLGPSDGRVPTVSLVRMQTS